MPNIHSVNKITLPTRCHGRYQGDLTYLKFSHFLISRVYRRSAQHPLVLNFAPFRPRQRTAVVRSAGYREHGRGLPSYQDDITPKKRSEVVTEDYDPALILQGCHHPPAPDEASGQVPTCIELPMFKLQLDKQVSWRKRPLEITIVPTHTL